tara:strand:+ start:1918 stop:2418 length:501 start_codon:yes stop_codon:yes gene_type:complete
MTMKNKSKYANGGPIAPTVMPTAMPRPSDFSIGPHKFGGMGGVGSPAGGRPMGGDMNYAGGNPNFNERTGQARPANRLGDGLMGNQRDMGGMQEAMKSRLDGAMQKRDAMRNKMAERFPQIAERLPQLAQRVPPKTMPTVGPGYKKGGKIDGCATRGMTKGIKNER